MLPGRRSLALVAVVVALVDASGAAAAGEGASAVVGGVEVPAGRWPDAVAVLGDGACTGTLVAPDVVLTAGHCIDMRPTRVVVDTIDYADDGVEIAVARAVAYPDWRGRFDVGLLLLAEAAPVRPRLVADACAAGRYLREGDAATLVGFGRTDVQASTSNTVLRQATTIIADRDCSSGDGCRPAIAPGGEFVAGGDRVGSCFGDSGGPVYLDSAAGPVLAGIVSRRTDSGAAPCAGGGIYVRVDQIRAWVEQASGRRLVAGGCEADDADALVDPGAGDDEAATEEIVGGCAAGAVRDSHGLGLALLALGLALTGRRRSC